MAFRILLGSTRPAKIDGAKAAFARIAELDPRFAAATMTAIDLTDIAPRMPMREADILEGARLRAATLLVRSEDRTAHTLAVGLEGGLDPIEVAGRRRLALKSWACVTDGNTWSYGAGGTVVLPDSIADAVEAGRELGDVVDELAGAGTRGRGGAWGVLTRGAVSRSDAFRVAVLSACAPFYNQEVYR
jgi:inosine/xanthosine triphosphatase